MESAEPIWTTATQLDRIAWLSKREPTKVFDNLMHHFNEESLRICFNELGGNKAIGVDGITKEAYGKELDTNLKDLISRMKRMGYRPGPVREALIPKGDNPGETRPLGISNFEDKIFQKMMQKVLDSIYEPVFLDNSYGFRPGRGCHDAIRALHNYLFANETETVLDVDLKNFFGSIVHGLLLGILEKKIKDKTLLRYVSRMFKSGILSKGELYVSDEGVPQGSICSPVLSNIFAHEVIDLWLERAKKEHCRGKVEIFRYADDLVICFQYAEDAVKMKVELIEQLKRYKVELNEDKTKEVKFSKNKQASGEKQGVFDFLGFTFYLAKSKNGYVIPKLRTSRKRIRTKLRNVKVWAMKVRNKPLSYIWTTFCSKLRGHIQYFGVSHNSKYVASFVYLACRILFKWLNRRSQRRSFTWESYKKYIARFPLPIVKICHKLF